MGKCAEVNHRFGSVIGVGFNSWSVGIHPGSPNGYCASCLANASTLACVCQRASRPQYPSYGILLAVDRSSCRLNLLSVADELCRIRYGAPGRKSCWMCLGECQATWWVLELCLFL